MCSFTRHAACRTLFTLQAVSYCAAKHLLLSQVAGLDVGWGQRLDLQLNAKSQRFELERKLPVGKFPYKFIFDDVWTYSADHPTLLDGDSINNYVEVVGNMSDPKINAARARVLSEEGLMEQEERETIIKWLETCDIV